MKTDLFFTKLQEDLNEQADVNGALITYSWVNIPLVYTQLVTIAVHLYFFVALFGRQYLSPTMYLAKDGEYVKVDPNIPGAVNLCGYDNKKDFYFPFFTSVQFLFYFGWLKVAEILINPFGDDDDDFELNYIIDRNFQISHVLVDGMDVEDFEKLEEDTFEGEMPPPSLPHTAASYVEEDDSPIFITDEIIQEVKEALDEEEPLFIYTSESQERCDSPSLSASMGRRQSIKSLGSTLYMNIKRNYSATVGDNAPMAVIEEGELEDPENPKEVGGLGKS